MEENQQNIEDDTAMYQTPRQAAAEPHAPSPAELFLTNITNKPSFFDE